MFFIFGIIGLIVWWGMIQIGDLKFGEIVVVLGVVGVMGSVVGQIVKIKGVRVIGICGSEDKCQWLRDDFGFDVVFNYKVENFWKVFKEVIKNYIDVYYDNGKYKGIGLYFFICVLYMLIRYSWWRYF